MATSINSLLSMGTGALYASQAAISTTGNNISNVNTVGYSRQSVLLKSNTSLDYSYGQIGQGVSAEQIIRAYDKFIESALVSQLGEAAKYDSAYYALRNIEGLFDESSVDGIGATLTAVFNSWNDLAQSSDSIAARQALISSSQTLASFIQSTDDTLAAMQEELESLIRDEVNTANSLIQEIADLNREINMHTVSGSNNANTLMDQRDAKVRELAEIIDISIQDNGAGDYFVTSGAGYLLVQSEVAYSLTIEGPQTENSLTADSPYKTAVLNTDGTYSAGTAHFSGSDTREYQIQVVDGGGAVDGGALFTVSLDGGQTWLTEDGGTTRDIDQAKRFEANTKSESVKAGELEIWFDAGTLAEGDKFTISPKNDIYWVSPTIGPVNISSQFYADGTENKARITGGALGGYLMARDEMIGTYRDQLDALAKSIIWEVNRLHSQGAGLSTMSSALGTYQVGRTDKALGSDTSDFAWSSYLTEGNLSFAFYDESGKNILDYPGLMTLDFSAYSSSGSANFDPSEMSLEDVRDAIKAATITYTDAGGNVVTENPLDAKIINGQLQITTTGDYTFAVSSDTTGLMAGLGINTFFTGTDASSIAVRGELVDNVNLVNAGAVNGAGEINQGDNSVANKIAELLNKTVNIATTGTASVNQSLLDYYATIVTKVGSDTLSVKNSATREVTLAQTLSDRREEVVGVSLDEELTNLIKFQSSYKAAAKLITTADEMLQTVLGLKQ
ncbi:flagellar hook-associated protein FlgK [Desulfovibrio sp. OttesenSCG-928-O18]|nr:flagellar hook-associated protein FlgK [Desulfovibrio sp. OttesenSCG-928-O18]